MRKAYKVLANAIWKNLADYWRTTSKELINSDKVEHCKLILYPSWIEGIPEQVVRFIGPAENAITETKYHYGDDGIITRISSDTYIRFEDLMSVAVDFNLNVDKIIEYYRVMLRHEFGHIIVSMNNDIGKSIDEIRAEYQRLRQQGNLPKLKIDASMESRLNWLICDMSQPSEKSANDAVGLSMDEIIAAERDRLISSKYLCKLIKKNM